MRGLILTRTQKDNERAFKTVLKQLDSIDYKSNFSQLTPPFLSIPLIAVEAVAFDLEKLKGSSSRCDALILTSKNALSFLRSLKRDSVIPVCVVGAELTRLVEQDERFTVVLSAPDVRGLMRAIEQDFDHGSRLVYSRGRVVSHDLASWAQGCGYVLDEFVVYDVVPVTAIPMVLDDFLSNGRECVLPFFSQRSFEIFRGLVEKKSEKALLELIQPLCISAGMLESVSDLFGKEAFAAKTPDLEGMSALIASHMFQK